MENVFLTSLTIPEVKQLFRSEIENYFAANPPKATPEKENEFLTLPEAAKYLRLAEQTVYGLVHRKQIPHSKKHKRLYFTKQDLQDFIKGGKRKTATEIQGDGERKMIEINS